MSHEITVIIPAHNAAATVETAIRSTLRALPPSAAVLVHDDASTDDTWDLLSSVRDPRLHLWRSGDRRGVADGLNLLLERVTSRLVARMDADDVVLPWRFRRQRQVLGQGHDVVFSTVGRFGAGVASLRLNPPVRLGPEAMNLNLLVQNPVAHATFIGRTALVHDLGGYRKMPSEDYDLWLRIAADGHSLVRDAVPTLLSREHPLQVTAARSWVAQARQSDGFRDAYRALSLRVLGLEPVWFDGLRGRESRADPAVDAALMQFADAVTLAAQHLSRPERILLDRRLRGRLTALEERRRASQGGG
ncbi:glycosyltransferase [Mumia sp. zg.B21]|uniref:glycosyltransferase family 2 protein n=1 Tax=Mumia sp. zg.B21 TaxID=2855447 RepID=UPI001C6E9C40|nr:glycosyltransferase [Mumia sp. zg.B21]MBW9210760.1 glycosyltransferase [Mumia sp. zg.B21]